MRVGSHVEVTESDGHSSLFEVVEIEVLPEDAAARRIEEQRGDGWLVLMTCYPIRYIGPAPQRLIAWARPAAAGA